jgi:hypothetical protein
VEEKGYSIRNGDAAMMSLPDKQFIQAVKSIARLKRGRSAGGSD